MAALLQRQVTGEGQMVDVSMLETMLNMLGGEVNATQFIVPPPGRPMFGPVATKDGYIMPAVAAERTFQGICQAAGHPEWITDPRFEKYADRRNNWGLFVDELETWSRTVTTAECKAAFDRHGVPNSPYRTVAEALADPQIAHREALAEVHDRGGAFRIMNAPFRLSAANTTAQGFAAALGEQTVPLLRELGYDEARIEAMSADGIIGMG